MPSTQLHRRFVQGTVALAAIVALACASDSVRSAIEAEIEKGVNAVRNKDLPAFIDQIPEATLGNDSLAIARGREAIHESMRDEWLRTTTMNISVEVQGVEAGKDTAIVESTMNWNRLVKTAEGTDTIISNVKHRELWRLTPKGWRSFEVLWMSGQKSTNGKIEKIGS